MIRWFVVKHPVKAAETAKSRLAPEQGTDAVEALICETIAYQDPPALFRNTRFKMQTKSVSILGLLVLLVTPLTLFAEDRSGIPSEFWPERS